MHRLFIDINVILDVAVDRKPYAVASQNILIYIAQKKAYGFCSALSYPILYYLVRKATSHGHAMNYIANILELFSVVDLNRKILERGIHVKMKDYEDALQAASAEFCEADYIVTRNGKDFRGSLGSLISPAEYLAAFSKD